MVDEVLLKQVMSSALKVEPWEIGPEASVETVASWTSLKHLNLIIALEEAFGVTIPDEEAAEITTYPRIVMVLAEALKGN